MIRSFLLIAVLSFVVYDASRDGNRRLSSRHSNPLRKWAETRVRSIRNRPERVADASGNSQSHVKVMQAARLAPAMTIDDLQLGDTPFQYCSGVKQLVQVQKFSIMGCSTSPCEFHVGKRYTAAITHMTSQTLYDLQVQVRGKATEFPYDEFGWVNIPTDNGPDVCKYNPNTCPAQANQPFTFVTSVTAQAVPGAPSRLTAVVQSNLTATFSQMGPLRLVSCMTYNVIFITD